MVLWSGGYESGRVGYEMGLVGGMGGERGVSPSRVCERAKKSGG